MKRAFIISFILALVLGLWINNLNSSEDESLRQSMLHNEIEREYIVYAPEDLPANAPLVVVSHGYTSSAETIMSYSGMNAVADKEKFLVVYPQGTTDIRGNNFFNVGYDFHKDSNIDDLGFIKALVKKLINEYEVNPDHVFATGMSNGGDLSYLLACEASDIFRAVAPIAGTMMLTTVEDCQPEKPMPIFSVNGNADDITWFNGDLSDEAGWGIYLDVPYIIDFWVNLNNLDSYETMELDDINTSDDSNITFTRYRSNDSNHEVWFYLVNNGGHNWPVIKTPYSFWDSLLGWWYFNPGNKDIDTSSEAWKFFEKYIN